MGAGLANFSPTADLTRQVSAYTSFLQAKEYTGRERAVLNNVFSANSFGPGVFEKAVSIVSMQDAYLHDFVGTGLPSEVASYKEVVSGEPVEEDNSPAADSVHKRNAGHFGVDPAVWAQTITAKIDLMKKVEDRLAEDLDETASARAGCSTLRIAGLCFHRVRSNCHQYCAQFLGFTQSEPEPRIGYV